MFEYDVFLSHATPDKPAVERVARRLRDEQGLRVFFDRWELVPGTHWQQALEEALAASRTCAVFLGPEGLGPWQSEEIRVALGQRVAAEPKRVIPVLLLGAQEDAVPEFLAQRTWVDFRNGADDEAAFDRLLAGIRGAQPIQEPAEQRALEEKQRVVPPSPKKSSTEAPSPWWRRARPRDVGILIGVLGALLTTLAWFFPRPPATTDHTTAGATPAVRPEIYSVRVQILDPEGRPVDGATVRVSSSNEPHLLPDGWWQVEIPRAKVPLDGEVVLWGEHPQWQSSREVLRLAEDPNPRAEIRLEVPRERISGVVVDAEGRTVEGARVSVMDHAGSSATSGRDGRFELWVTAARNEKARLHVEHDGFPPQDGSCYVGRDGCSLVLEAE